MEKIGKTTPLLISVDLQPVAVHQAKADLNAFVLTLELQGDSPSDLLTVRAMIQSENLPLVIEHLTRRMNEILKFQTPPSGAHH
jgi:hypothetical protein